MSSAAKPLADRIREFTLRANKREITIRAGGIELRLQCCLVGRTGFESPYPLPKQKSPITGLFVFWRCGESSADDALKENDIDTGSVRLIQIAEGIYAISPNFAGANGALILNESGNIVIDTHGTPASARALNEEEAIEAAAASTVIEGFRRSFVSNEEDGMFDQMVGWTIARAYMDL